MGLNIVFNELIKGWDWAPRIVVAGIWKNVYLSGWNTCKINNIGIHLNELTDKSAVMRADIELNCTS